MNEEQDSVEVILQDGKTLNFKYKTSLNKAAQVIAFLTTNGSLVASSSSVLSGKKNSSNSPLEAVRDSGARTFPQKIAAIGHYLVRRDERETFDPNEILTLLKRMGDTPRNFSRDIKNAELLGYISREPNGEYFLTDTAVEEIESRFENAIPAESSKKKRARKGKKTEKDSN